MTTMKRAKMTAKFVAALEASDRTLADLASTCDLSPQQLSALANGFPAGPSKQTRLLKLAKVLGVKPADALRACVQTTTGFRNQDRSAK